MMMEIIHELTLMVDTRSVTCEQVLAWARRVETQGVQTTMLNSFEEGKEFNTVNQKTKVRPPAKHKCKYSGRQTS